MAQHGKKYNAAASSFDSATQHGSTEAVTKVKTLASAKFDETVELSVRLGVDPRKADQMVRGTVALPSGTGTDVLIAVFAAGDAAQAARDAGAEFVGTDDLLAQVEGGMMDFDLVIATPDLMPQVGKLGRQLGPSRRRLSRQRHGGKNVYVPLWRDVRARREWFQPGISYSALVHISKERRYCF